jgi:phenylpropionate dioxygenase-like ring-hydroxylating dioxygenase large terminal subunit
MKCRAKGPKLTFKSWHSSVCGPRSGQKEESGVDLDSYDMKPFDIGTGDLYPDRAILDTGKVDLAVYTAQERFDAEKEVFGRVWLNVAEAAEIPNPGDWVVRDIKVRSASAIIVRGKDGVIRAYHNICSHRGMKLVWDKKGRGGKFSCPYHAWIYDSGGALIHLPDEGCFPHVDKKESGLSPIHCDVWEGFIFINLNPANTQSLLDYLSPVTQRIGNMPFASYPYAAYVGSEIKANWKLGIEAQCEPYHVGALHAKTVGKMLSSKDNPFCHFIDSELLGAHRMSSVPRNPDFSPALSKLVQCFAFANATQMVVQDTGAQEKPELSFANHPDVNRASSDLWGTDQYVLYPHFIIQVAFGGWWLHRFWPLAPGNTYWEAVYHFEKPSSLRNQFAIQYSLAFNRDTLMEDNLALVQQQEVMESGAKKIVQFGDSEIICKHLAAVSEAVTNDIGSRLAVAAE